MVLHLPVHQERGEGEQNGCHRCPLSAQASHLPLRAQCSEAVCSFRIEPRGASRPIVSFAQTPRIRRLLPRGRSGRSVVDSPLKRRERARGSGATRRSEPFEVCELPGDNRVDADPSRCAASSDDLLGIRLLAQRSRWPARRRFFDHRLPSQFAYCKLSL